MSINGLQTAVLEAGGNIEERAGYPDFHKFVVQYVFTKESLENFVRQIRLEGAEDAWAVFEQRNANKK